MKSSAFWTRKYKQNIGKMIGTCYRYVLDRDLAEDLAHDAFLKAIEHADSFKGFGRFDGWLMRITVNTALHHLRDNRRIVTDNTSVEELENLPEQEEDNGDGMMSAIMKADFTQEEIVEAVGQLPEHHRVVFNLYVFDHFTHKQIAEMQGISENTSKSHLARARKELQQILFNKTQNSKRPMMALLFLLPKIGKSAVDQWCRHQLAGFSMEPATPLTATQLSAAAGSVKLFSAIGLRAASVPLAFGTATTAVGTLVAVEFHEPTTLPSEELPQPTIVQLDSSASEQDTTPYEEVVPTLLQPKVVQRQDDIPSDEPAALDSTSTEAEASEAPVVVKKIIRKKNTTVVIKDTNNSHSK